MRHTGGGEVQLPSFLISVPDGSESSTSCPGPHPVATPALRRRIWEDNTNIFLKKWHLKYQLDFFWHTSRAE